MHALAQLHSKLSPQLKEESNVTLSDESNGWRIHMVHPDTCEIIAWIDDKMAVARELAAQYSKLSLTESSGRVVISIPMSEDELKVTVVKALQAA